MRASPKHSQNFIFPCEVFLFAGMNDTVLISTRPTELSNVKSAVPGFNHYFSDTTYCDFTKMNISRLTVTRFLCIVGIYFWMLVIEIVKKQYIFDYIERM